MGIGIGNVVKKSPFSFAMMILSMMFFIGIVFFAVNYMRQFLWLNILICSLPFLLFGTVFYLCIRDKIGKTAAFITNVILIIVLGMLMVVNGIWMLFADFTEHTTNIREYNKVLKIYNYPNAKNIKHFPQEIPKYAKNISFWENPQFLQGGSRVLLMYETTGEEIKKYRNNYEPLAQVIVNAEEKEKLTDKYCIPSIDVMNGKRLTDKFEVIILESTPFGNHGYTYGLAINDITNEILFFSEVW